MHKYRLISIKGEGTFSEVLKAQSIKNGKCVAIKCMKNHFESIQQVNNLREIQALRRLSPHPHIIKLHEVLYDHPSGRLALVFELMDCNIYELIKGRRQYLREETVRGYMYQLVKSMDHMHRNGIFHRDIKPENILIVDKTLKLADFGSCRGIYSKQPYTEYISTRWYRAPECLLTDGWYSVAMDVWGMGCVIFEILALFPLFPGKNEADQIERIHKILGTPSASLLAKFQKYNSHQRLRFKHHSPSGIAKLLPHTSREAVDLIEKMLIYDPEERITSRQALRHPWFADLRAEEKRRRQASKDAKRAKEDAEPKEAGGTSGAAAGGGGASRREEVGTDASTAAAASVRTAASHSVSPSGKVTKADSILSSAAAIAAAPTTGPTATSSKGPIASVRSHGVPSPKIATPTASSSSPTAGSTSKASSSRHHHRSSRSKPSPSPSSSAASPLQSSESSRKSKRDKSSSYAPTAPRHGAAAPFGAASPSPQSGAALSSAAVGRHHPYGTTASSSSSSHKAGIPSSSAMAAVNASSPSPGKAGVPWLRRPRESPAEARAAARVEANEQQYASPAMESVLRARRSHAPSGASPSGPAMQPISGRSGGGSYYAAARSSSYAAPVAEQPFMSPLRSNVAPNSQASPSMASRSSGKHQKRGRRARRVRGELSIAASRNRRAAPAYRSPQGRLQPVVRHAGVYGGSSSSSTLAAVPVQSSSSSSSSLVYGAAAALPTSHTTHTPSYATSYASPTHPTGGSGRRAARGIYGGPAPVLTAAGSGPALRYGHQHSPSRAVGAAGLAHASPAGPFGASYGRTVQPIGAAGGHRRVRNLNY